MNLPNITHDTKEGKLARLINILKDTGEDSSDISIAARNYVDGDSAMSHAYLLKRLDHYKNKGDSEAIKDCESYIEEIMKIRQYITTHRQRNSHLWDI